MDEPQVCAACGQPAAFAQDELPLCPACLQAMIDRPLPRWLYVTAAIIGLIVLLALLKFPASLGAEIAFERGKRAEAARNYPLAEQQYAIVVKRFPSSTLALARLGIASYRAGDIVMTIDCYDKLRGRESSDKVIIEFNAMMSELEQKLEQQQVHGGQEL